MAASFNKIHSMQFSFSVVYYLLLLVLFFIYIFTLSANSKLILKNYEKEFFIYILVVPT